MRKYAILALFLFWGTVLFAQTHVSVPLGHEVYYILDQAEARGLCSPLPAVKPYTRGRVVEAVNEILAAEGGRFGGLSDAERRMLENIRAEFTRGEAGLDLLNGIYRFDIPGEKGIRFSGDFGVAVESLNSGAYYAEDGETYLGTDTWGIIFVEGDVGENFSFNVDFSGGIMLAERNYLGTYDTYATELDEPAGSNNINRRVEVYGQPMAFFPYSYQKNWDGFMFQPGSITASGMEAWPQNPAIAARMWAEMSGSVLGDMLLLRAGRFRREWGAMSPGSSLVFNAFARPFIGLEAVFNPAPWFSFSSITGVLEFDNSEGIRDPAMTFQNAFSLQQVEFNYKNYLHIDFGSSSIWSKRFELGYLFPLLDNFFYQNFIGNFDNMALHFNIRGRYPGLGGLWFSFFLDEAEISSMLGSLFDRDRHMFAYQAGLQGIIPALPFASITAAYTKIEPYNYTHTRVYMPWYSGDEPMETSYTNNGVSLGHYLPPNSDELKLRFDIRPLLKTAGHFQYQLIRHGADYGPHQVDGSSLISELDPSGRSEKASLVKNFLNDGAYQWLHIIKAGAEHTFRSLPITVFGEAGVAYSYFTDISDAEYARYNPLPSGGTARPLAEGSYSTSTAFILTVGFRMFR